MFFYFHVTIWLIYFAPVFLLISLLFSILPFHNPLIISYIPWWNPMVSWCFLGVENNTILKSTEIKEKFLPNGLKQQPFMPKNTVPSNPDPIKKLILLYWNSLSQLKNLDNYIRSGLTFKFSFPVMWCLHCRFLVDKKECRTQIFPTFFVNCKWINTLSIFFWSYTFQRQNENSDKNKEAILI